MDHPAAIPTDKLMEQCDVVRTRRGGPGGQHRNKVSTAIVITHRPTRIVGAASERRSQSENLTVALSRLRMNLALAIRNEVTDDRPPSPLWQSFVCHEKIKISPRNNDFPVILAEALDFVVAFNGQPHLAAVRLGVTGSQLTKLLQQEPAAWTVVSGIRKQLGLKPLK